MYIQFLGATKTVTGSKYLLTCDGHKILVDCGLFQGLKELRLRNWAKLPIDPAEIDAVLLTHAHIDHSGYLPLLARNGFKGRIYCTHATKDLCAIMLPDSGFLQEEEARRANKYGYSKHKPALPLYTREDADRVLSQFYPVDFGQKCAIDLSGSNKVEVCFKRAGHILGAASVLLQYAKTKVLFSGDLGRPQDPLMYQPEPMVPVDYLIVESTYGDFVHEEVDPQQQLGDVINRTINRGGTLVIPSFAVGRTQNILYYIYQLQKNKKIPHVPVFLDSPLAINATKIFESCSSEHRLDMAECDKVCAVAKYVSSVEESKLIDTYTTPKIIISASGMAVGGRVLHHLRVFSGDSRNTILFCGFQASGTRGDKMLRGISEIKLLGEVVSVNAEVVSLSNISAHADSKEILDWLQPCAKTPPRQVFITHGEFHSAEALKDKIESQLQWSCIIPQYLQSFTL